MRILVFGLPGSGKTTLAKLIAEKTGYAWFNADVVRSEYNDWDFSEEGRSRQLQRMMLLSHSAENTICDFVAPTGAVRRKFDADESIWMNTIQSGRFADTNALFECHDNYSIEITTFDAEKWTDLIIKELKLCQK